MNNVNQLAVLQNAPQWVAWRYQYIPGKPKPKKPPFNPGSMATNPHQASPTDPATWATYAQAVAFAKAAQMAGVGIVLTRNLGLTLVDLDNCFDDAGIIQPWAAAIVERLNSYTEYSPSGRGLHILVYGAVVVLKTDQVEIYSTERYATVTGRPYGVVRPIRQAQAELEILRAEYAPTDKTPSLPPQPVEKAVVLAGDEAVIAILRQDPKQSARWAGNVSGNRSSHLFGLINGLIWLCGDDRERIGRLVRQSGLYDSDRHEQNSGDGRSNLSVSIFNAIRTWRGTPYKWPTETVKTTEQPATETQPEPPEPTLTERLNTLRFWLRYGGLAVLTKGRTFDTDLAVADTLIDIAIERNCLNGLAIGLETLRSRAGLGSTSTARKALTRLSWLVTKVEDGDRITRADRYSFNVGALDWAIELARTPGSPICIKSHVGKQPAENIMRFDTNDGIYSAYRSSDTFSTGLGGSGRAWGNQIPGAGKLLALLIDLLVREGLPMSGAMLAETTGRSYQVISRALTRGCALGLLDRQRESGGGIVRRFWYSVPADVEQRIALAAVEMRSYGRAVDKAAVGAIGLQMHADRLLNLDELGKWQLDDAQRETLKSWSVLANTEYKGFCQIADLAATLDKGAIKEKIKSGAEGADRNRRAIQAARQFNAAILPGEKLSIKQRVRLFRHFAAMNGYFDLARQDDATRRLVDLAFRTVQIRTAYPEPAPRSPQVQFGDLRHIEQAATFEQRFGVAMPG